MTNRELTKNYWHYYLMLEKKLIEMADNVDINPDNYSTFSNGFAMLLQSIGAELDNFFKEYCGFILSDRKSITDYASYILAQNPDITNVKVRVNIADIILEPFKGWNSARAAQSLSWWLVFDELKHNRVENKADANLENTINMLAALFCLEMMSFRECARADEDGNLLEPDIPDVDSKLFYIDNWRSKFISMEKVYYTTD